MKLEWNLVLQCQVLALTTIITVSKNDTFRRDHCQSRGQRLFDLVCFWRREQFVHWKRAWSD